MIRHCNITLITFDHISTISTHYKSRITSSIQKQYGFREVVGEQAGVLYEYEEMRASFMMTHAPELLGEYAKYPELKGHSEEEIREFMEQIEARKEMAKKVPKEKFDIDFHKFEKKMGDNEMHIIIEKKYEHISGGASGKKTIKKFHKIFKDIYRYYGVTQEDIDQKTKRYETLIRRLAVK